MTSLTTSFDSATSSGRVLSSRRPAGRRTLVATGAVVAAVLLGFSATTPAEAALVPTVSLGTAADYSVLAASTVTNTGPSVLGQSVGLWPQTSITGFPPGSVLAPGTIEATTVPAQLAQADASAAYTDASNRPVDATTTADLTNLQLGPGVYSGPSKSSLLLSGPLVLDGQGDANAVFIFQTDSTLTTATSSTVTLINGALECNVFWQVGSSATLGSGSSFVGNILALSSVTVTTGVAVHGRAFALNGAVTLDNDVFTRPNCTASAPATTTTVANVTTVASAASTTVVATVPSTTLDVTGGTLPRTGGSAGAMSGTAGLAMVIGAAVLLLARRRPARR